MARASRPKRDKKPGNAAGELEVLNEVGMAVAAEIDLERAVQVVTDAATRLSGAAFGSFFDNVVDDKGEAIVRSPDITKDPCFKRAMPPVQNG